MALEYGSRTGSVYLRGTRWWIKYYVRGKSVRESTGSVDRQVAEAMLSERCVQTLTLKKKLGSTEVPAFLDSNHRGIERILLKSAVGTSSELLVCSDLLMHGYEVFRAVSQHASCDLVAMKDGVCHRVQVKTGTVDKRGCILISMLKERGRYDLLAAVVKYKGIFYRRSGSENQSQRLSDFSTVPL